jgi:hypothetical protein
VVELDADCTPAWFEFVNAEVFSIQQFMSVVRFVEQIAQLTAENFQLCLVGVGT